MSTIAEFTIESEEFLLGKLIAEFPDLSVEIERVVPADGRVMPYLWAFGDDLQDFEAAVETNPNVEAIEVLDRVEGKALYKITWKEPTERLIAGLSATSATILEAFGDRRWRFRIRFEDDGGLASFNELCKENDINYRLDRVFPLRDRGRTPHEYGLTDEQQAALLLAVEMGYFEVPRRTSMSELAAELDISAQAVSERIRRGANKVLEAEFPEASSPDV